MVSVESGWNEGSLHAVFSRGLNELIKNKLVSYTELTNLDDFISLPICMDNRPHR